MHYQPLLQPSTVSRTPSTEANTQTLNPRPAEFRAPPTGVQRVAKAGGGEPRPHERRRDAARQCSASPRVIPPDGGAGRAHFEEPAGRRRYGSLQRRKGEGVRGKPAPV